jgi:phage replication-related protein YjqB (UPF0714/DUF867 family)
VLIAAPHGDSIERHTAAIARQVAGTDLSYYLSEGRKRADNRDLHITSTNFDEPRFARMAANCDVVLAIHGKAKPMEVTYLGGAYVDGIEQVTQHLRGAGYDARRETDIDLLGSDRSNLCNRGRRGQGIQLELGATMPDVLAASPQLLDTYAASVRAALRSLGLITRTTA